MEEGRRPEERPQERPQEHPQEHQTQSASPPPKGIPAENNEGEEDAAKVKLASKFAGKVKSAKRISLAALIIAAIALLMSIVDSIICRYSVMVYGRTGTRPLLKEKYMDLWWFDTIIALAFAISAFVLMMIKKGTFCVIIIVGAIGLGFGLLALIHTIGACIICGRGDRNAFFGRTYPMTESTTVQEIIPMTTESSQAITLSSANLTLNEGSDKWPSNCGKVKTSREPRIVGGLHAPLGSVPWQALIQRGRIGSWTTHCGGTVLRKDVVMTAAHCFHDLSLNTYRIILKEDYILDNDGTEVFTSIKSIIPHPQYDSTTLKNDIAILILETHINFDDDLQPACLPNPLNTGYSSLAIEGLSLTISGWGRMGGRGASQLQKATVKIINRNQCKSRLVALGSVPAKTMDDTMICLLEDGVGSCTGDSGGPAVLKKDNVYISIGIISWGHNCTFSENPDVLQSVLKHVNWIEEVCNE